MQKTFLFVSAQYLPTLGGVERYTNNLARRLRAMGHRVIVLTSALHGLPAQEVDAHGIEIIRIPSIGLMNGRFPVLRPGAQFREMAKQLWSRSIDYCVINTYFYPLSMYAAGKTKNRKIPSLMINHGSAWLMTGSKPVQLAGRIYERCAAWVCHRSCKRFFGVSEMARQWMQNFGIIAEGIITNAIDPVDVHRSVNRDLDWRAHLGLTPEAKLIAFVGRMIPEKGVDQMITAMESIRRLHPNAYLVMAGAGPLLDQWKEKSPEGVFLTGGQAYSDVLALLQQADLFCLPSRSEGFACTVLEAAAMGCPVITTATGGSPQLLCDRRYGILLESMSPEAISTACLEALGDVAWRASASALAEQRLRENFTWDAAVQQLLQAFQLK